MPQPKRGSSTSSSGAGSRSSGRKTTAARKTRQSSGRSSSASSASKSSGRSTRRTPANGRKRTSQRATAGTRSATAKATSATDRGVEAAATRLRKLNERIIEAGKSAGDTTLSSYESVLKSIAKTLERGPGTSDIDWISTLATQQAKFIRDVTNAWTSAARDILK
jgi:hypothetical protein